MGKKYPTKTPGANLTPAPPGLSKWIKAFHAVFWGFVIWPKTFFSRKWDIPFWGCVFFPLIVIAFISEECFYEDQWLWERMTVER